MKRIGLYLLPLWFLVSCNGDVFYSAYADVDDKGWLPTDSVCFDIDVEDTSQVFDFLVEVRNSVSYPYSNTFFFIFNHLHQTGKQLILTSDCAPVDLKGLEDRLITRFKWGLTAEILRPDFQLRKDILNNRIWRDGLAIPEEVVDYIADNVRNNVRDLEGVLASLLAYSTLTNAQIDMELTEQVVGRLVRSASSEITIDTITEAVCRHFNIPEKMLVTASRKREIAQARMVVMYLAREMTNKSLVEIGRQLNRNHATVLHAISTIQNDMEGDAFLRKGWNLFGGLGGGVDDAATRLAQEGNGIMRQQLVVLNRIAMQRATAAWA